MKGLDGYLETAAVTAVQAVPADCGGLSPHWIFQLAPTLPRDSHPWEDYLKISKGKAVPVKNRGGSKEEREAEPRKAIATPEAASVLG